MIGIDGTRNGWITAEYTGKTWRLEFHEELETIEAGEALIDIPVGLSEDSIRKCDVGARKFLAPERHYSIFNCPVRDAVYADSYEEACKINEEKTGKRISKQSWNIVPKIREANEYSGSLELKESHPEVFFKSLKKGCVKNSKNTDEGLEDRLNVLKNYGSIPDFESIYDSRVSKDDCVDAMVLALATEFSLESIGGNEGSEILKPSIS